VHASPSKSAVLASAYGQLLGPLVEAPDIDAFPLTGRLGCRSHARPGGIVDMGWEVVRDSILAKAPRRYEKSVRGRPVNGDGGCGGRQRRRRRPPGSASSSYIGPASGLDDLAAMLDELARSLHEQESLEDTLCGIVSVAVGAVPGAQQAAASVIEGRRVLQTRVGTAELVCQVDKARYETGEGPCLDLLYEQRTVRLSDMATESRWRGFIRRCLRTRGAEHVVVPALPAARPPVPLDASLGRADCGGTAVATWLPPETIRCNQMYAGYTRGLQSSGGLG
jgi:hypothetical protein